MARIKPGFSQSSLIGLLPMIEKISASDAVEKKVMTMQMPVANKR